MNPQSVVDAKNKLLAFLKDREDFTVELNSLDSQLKAQIETLNLSKEKALADLNVNIEEYIKSEKERQTKLYQDKLKQLADEKDRALEEVKTKIEESKKLFLEKNSSPLEQIKKFKSQDAQIKEILDRLPIHKIYEKVQRPKLDSLKDVHIFNQTLSQLYLLESIKDIDLNKYGDKSSVIMKPVELFVNKFGETKRALIEIIYIVILFSTLASYRQWIVPLITVPTVVLLTLRYRNAATLKKYCSAYFQAHNYASEMEDDIKKILLQNQEKELESYNRRTTGMILSTYETECKKIKAPDLNSITMNTDTESINKQFEDAIANIKRETAEEKAQLTEKLKGLEVEIGKATVELNELSEECKTLLDKQQGYGILPSYIHYGQTVNKHFGIDYPYLYPTIKESCAITYDSTSKEDAVNFLKYYLLQLWRYVEPGFVTFNIIDTKDFGKDVADITVPEEKLINIFTDANEVSQLLSDTVTELKKRNTTILRKHSSIEDYNKMMHEQDASICPYIVYINLNPQIEHLMNQGHIALLQQASNCGILMINLMDKDMFAEMKPEDHDKAIEMYDFHEYKVSFENNNIAGGLELDTQEIFTPVKINKDKYVDVADSIYTTLKEGGIKTLWYHEHRERNYPKNWSKIPIKDIEVMPGNINGEKDKPVTLLIGDSNPHVLLAGETGSGKSVLLNSILLSVCHNYSPDWVQIIGVDFKGVELLIYGKPVSMPHFRGVSASRDAEYVLSLFDDMLGEMRARNKMFDSVLGFKNYVDFCKAMQKQEEKDRIWHILTHVDDNKALQTLLETKEGKNLYKSMTINRKYPVLPRLMFVIDEFADMFLISDDLKAEATARIKSLAKVARSAGIHMVFASQNMEGTVPEETLEQFKLRVCLPCSESVAKSLTGNSEAAHIGRGYAIANNNPAEREKANVFFKVAYEETEVIKSLIKDLNESATALGYPKTIPIYNEAEMFDYKDFRSRLVSSPKLYNTNVYILGETRLYQRMNIPVTMVLNYKERQNVCILSKDKDLLDSTTVVYLDNYAKKGQLIYFQTGDDEFLDKYDLSGQFEKTQRCEYNSSTDALHGWLVKMLEHRTQARKNGDNIKPIQVILHSINSMTSFGIDGGKEDTQEYLSETILELNKHGVYFVLCSTNAKSMRRLFPYFTHTLVSAVDERDSGYLPEIAQKALKGSGNNVMFYTNSDTGVIKSFKPYTVFKTELVDESVYFMD